VVGFAAHRAAEEEALGAARLPAVIKDAMRAALEAELRHWGKNGELLMKRRGGRGEQVPGYGAHAARAGTSACGAKWESATVRPRRWVNRLQSSGSMADSRFKETKSAAPWRKWL
jgi:hypothetical protein